MEPNQEAQEFLQKLSDYQFTLGLIQERIGPDILDLMQRFVAKSITDEKMQARVTGFMVMGYLLHGHLERRAIEERLQSE